MVENLLLSLLGGALGLWIAIWGLRLFQAIVPSSTGSTLLAGMQTVPFDAIRMDGPVLVFTLLACVFVSLLFGLIPALQVSSNLDHHRELKEGARGTGRSGGGHDHFRDGLIVAQVSLALMLLIGAGLLTGSLARLMRVNPGYNPENVVCAEIALPASRYAEQPRISAFFSQLIERVAALPGVDRAGAVNCPPFAVNNMAGFIIEGRAPMHPGQFDTAMYRVATPGYLETMAIPVVQGRPITREDNEASLPVVVIDETMARRFWPNESPLGARINIGRPCTVVGVVGSVKQFGLDDTEYPTVYFPQLQQPNARRMTLVVRTVGNPLGSVAAIRMAVSAIDPDQPVARIRSMESAVTESTGNRRLTTWGMGSFAALALLLAAIGLYGVVSYSVTRRTREIGIRMALGAQPGDALRLLLNYGMRLTLIGIGIGLGGAFVMTRLLTTLLYATSAADPATFASVSVLLAAVALLATYLPARRVIRIDPVVALRGESE
jgi:putative ABC transport system permease protein